MCGNFQIVLLLSLREDKSSNQEIVFFSKILSKSPSPPDLCRLVLLFDSQWSMGWKDTSILYVYTHQYMSSVTVIINIHCNIKVGEAGNFLLLVGSQRMRVKVIIHGPRTVEQIVCYSSLFPRSKHFSISSLVDVACFGPSIVAKMMPLNFFTSDPGMGDFKNCSCLFCAPHQVHSLQLFFAEHETT